MLLGKFLILVDIHVFPVEVVQQREDQQDQQQQLQLIQILDQLQVVQPLQLEDPPQQLEVQHPALAPQQVQQAQDVHQQLLIGMDLNVSHAIFHNIGTMTQIDVNLAQADRTMMLTKENV